MSRYRRFTFTAIWVLVLPVLGLVFVDRAGILDVTWPVWLAVGVLIFGLALADDQAKRRERRESRSQNPTQKP